MTGFIPSDLGYVDIAIILFMLVGLFEGFIKGLSFEIPKFTAMLAGIWVALIFATPLSEYVAGKANVNVAALEAAFLFTIAFSAAFLFKVIFLLIGKVVSLQFIYFVERVIGALVGGMRFIFLFCFFSYILLSWPTEFFKPYYGDLSYLGRGVERVIPKFEQIMQPLTRTIAGKFSYERNTAQPQKAKVVTQEA